MSSRRRTLELSLTWLVAIAMVLWPGPASRAAAQSEAESDTGAEAAASPEPKAKAKAKTKTKGKTTRTKPSSRPRPEPSAGSEDPPAQEASPAPDASPVPVADEGESTRKPAGREPEKGPADREEGEQPGVIEPPVDRSPAEERAEALVKPVTFHSKGYWKAVMVKVSRDFHVTLSANKTEGKLTSVGVRIVDHTDGDKVTTGSLEVTASGTFRAKKPELIAAANVGAIDPVLRRKLLKGAGPFKTKGQIETKGEVRIVDVTHKRQGDVADDGSMRVESTSVSADGKLNMVTVVTLAPDGLPWLAETDGTIAKGPVNVEVHVRLVRDGIKPPTDE